MEASKRPGSQNVAELRYIKDTKTIEFLVPKGTRLADLSAKLSTIISGDILGELPRGCQSCTSGDHLLVREYMELVNPAVLVNLDTMKVVRER